MESTRSAIRSFRSSTAFITFVVAYAVFTDQFLFAAILPVYPFSLQERTGVPEDRVQFWVALLLGMFGISCVLISMPWGWYTDRSKERRIPFAIGLLILLGATLLLWFTTTLAGQVMGRILQGISSAVVWTTGMAVIVDTVGQKHIGEYMGYVCIALNAGSFLAPFIGGIVYEKRGYHAVFGLIIAIIVFDIILRAIMKERSTELKPETIDIVVQLEAGKETKTTVVETTIVDQVSINSQSTLVPCVPSKIPAIFRLLFSIRFCVALWGVMVLAAVFAGFQATLAIFVHDTFDWDATGGGLIFIPLSLPALFGPIIGRLTDRYGGRWFAVSGFLLFGVSLVLLRFVEENTLKQKVLLCALLVMVGSCMALNLEPLFAEITYGATRLEREDEKAGVNMDGIGYYGSAYSWFNMAWAGGCAFGPLMAGMIMDHAGWNTMTWALGLLGGVTAVPVGLWLDGWYFAKQEEEE